MSRPSGVEILFSSPELFSPGLEKSVSLVVILGWYGSKISQLKNYAAISREGGWQTACAVLPNHAVFGKEEWRQKFALDLLQSINFQYSNAKVDIVFYFFSNGGALVYPHLIHYFSGKKSKLVMRGAILDSAPGVLSFTKGYKAFIATRPPLSVKLFAAFALFSATSLLTLSTFTFSTFILKYISSSILQSKYRGVGAALLTALVLLLCLKGIRRKSHLDNRKYWSVLEKNPLPHPELFIFSTEDELCESKPIEELVALREITPPNHIVQTLKFTDSAHVRHFLDHKEEYTKTVFEFICLCFGS